MTVLKNITYNFSAGLFSKVSYSLIRILQVPLLISFLGVEEFGRWTVLSTIPSWLAFTNLGFGSVSSNQMSMYAARGEYNNIRKIFSTSIALITLILIVGSICCIIIVPFIKWETILKTDISRHQELFLAVICISLTVFISFFNEVFAGVFRASHKAHLGILLTSISPWLNLIAIFISLHFSKRFDSLSLSILLSNLIFLICFAKAGLKIMPDISFSFHLVQIKEFKYLFNKGFAFQAFPLGNALTIQGNIIIVQYFLGPSAVALFGTAKTLVNTVKQVIDIICQATWPEISHLIGADELRKAAKIHQSGVALALIISGLGILTLLLFGRSIYNIWLGNNISMPYDALVLFLLPILFNALWFTSSVVHLASNEHEGLAIRYIVAAILSTLTCVVLTKAFGIKGTAVSIIVMDLILIPYVVKRSLELTNDTMNEFLTGVFSTIANSKSLIKRHLAVLKKG
jgi:O-antigen/teichoic acid export membrane protein